MSKRMGEEVMKARVMTLFLCGILALGCEKQGSEDLREELEVQIEESEALKKELRAHKRELQALRKESESQTQEVLDLKKESEIQNQKLDALLDELLTLKKELLAPKKKELAQSEKPAKAMASKIGNPAVALTGLEWVKGRPAVTFEPGSIYVVEFWATWCPPCRTSIPHLTKIQRKYRSKKVTVIGISSETMDKVKPYVNKMGAKMNYTVAIDKEGKVNKGYMRAFNQNGIPHAFIVDGKGQIAWHGHPMAGLDETLAEVLRGSGE